MRRAIPFLLFITTVFSIKAQQLRLYDWASLQFYRSGVDVAETPSYMVFNTTTGLVFINKSNTDDVQHLTTIDGLNGSNIQKVRYNAEANKLLIFYSDGSFDLMDGDRHIVNLQDIKNNNVLVPNKDLLAAVSAGKYMYLCFSFGMTEFDMSEQVFTNTLSAEGGVNAIAATGSRLYIVNNKSLLTIDRSVRPNISYIGNWTRLQFPDTNKPADTTFRGLATFRDQVFTTFNKKLYRVETDGSYTFIDTLSTLKSVAYINSGGDYLMIGGSCNPDNLDNKGCIGEVALYNAELEPAGYNRQNMADNRYAAQSGDKIWFADSYHGYRYLNLPDLSPGFINLDSRSPWSNDVDAILKTGDALYVAPGAHSSIYQGVGNKQGLFIYKDQSWTVHNLYNDPFFAYPVPIADLSAFAYNDNTGELAIASYTNGIVSIKGEEKKVYNSENSALQTVPGDPNNTRVSDVAFDAEGNLWAANVLSPASLYVRTPAGSDNGFKNSFGEVKITQFTIDPVNGYLWCVEPARGIIVYDPGDNVISASDDQWKILSVRSSFENQNILPRSIYSDSDGRIWIGTVSGVFVIDCGSDIFKVDNNCETRFPYIQDENGLGAFLNGQTVNVITEDGAGRKWFGSNNGIYVTNPSVDEVVLHLTADNSPLADNNVTVLEIDKKEGIVYIGTRAGIQMYRTDASIGNPYHDPKLVIYPNPVRPFYDGPIVIQGLAHDSSVKIADINGKLVFETMSLGGQAIWYGKDFNGKKVGSGVYNVLGTTTLNLENPTGIIGKIIYIR